MGRRSNTSERRDQILDAFECCILRTGVKGVTLECVAEQAGLRRSLIRYHIGNRDALLKALCSRFDKSFSKDLEKLSKAMPQSNVKAPLIQSLFYPDEGFDKHSVKVAIELDVIRSLHSLNGLNSEGWFEKLSKTIVSILQVDYSCKHERVLLNTAFSLISLMIATQAWYEAPDEGAAVSMAVSAANGLLENLQYYA